jgi:hypothetical protein
MVAKTTSQTVRSDMMNGWLLNLSMEILVIHKQKKKNLNWGVRTRFCWNCAERYKDSFQVKKTEYWLLHHHHHKPTWTNKVGSRVEANPAVNTPGRNHPFNVYEFTALYASSCLGYYYYATSYWKRLKPTEGWPASLLLTVRPQAWSDELSATCKRGI